MNDTLVKREDTTSTNKRHSYMPHVDILETAVEVRLVLDVPGVAPEDLDIQCEKGTLTIQGKINERGPTDGKFVLREYRFGDYRRTFQIGDKIDPNGLSAEYSQGVLTVHLRKAPEVQPRKVNVQVV
jgi:HSP20 family protein